VEEETGIRPVLGQRLPSVAYLAEGRHKQVDYWAARPAAAGGEPGGQRPGTGHGPGAAGAAANGAAVSTQDRFVPNDEVDAIAWLPAGEARPRLTYTHDAAVLDAFSAGPASTAPVILVRHAAAVTKQAWAATGHPEDLHRPLSPRGRGQAAKLAEILGCYPPARVLSSAAERCAATVTPYAERAGTLVETEPAFTLRPGAPRRTGGGWAATPAARQRVHDAVTAGHPVIICGHRQNMPSLLAWAWGRRWRRAPSGCCMPAPAAWCPPSGTTWCGQSAGQGQRRRPGRIPVKGGRQ
jgi:8-oxo-(d)GTP phosphatase